MAFIDQFLKKDSADALLVAYKAQLRKELTEQLMPVAKEVVAKAVDAALVSLELSIKMAYHDYARELVVKLSVDGVDKERNDVR